MYGSRLLSLVGRRHSPISPPNRDGCRYQLRHKCPGSACCLSSMYNLNSQFSCRAAQTSHTRHQPLRPNNESNRDVSHTRHQPLCLTMTTQRHHTQDINHWVLTMTTHRHHTQNINHWVLTMTATHTSHTREQPLCLTMTATQTSHTRQQPLCLTITTHRHHIQNINHWVLTMTATHTLHTRQQPLCLTMTTQRRHTQDNTHCV